MSFLLSYARVAVFAMAMALASAAVADDAISDMPAGAYDLDLTHASVVWKVDHLGFSTYPGRFTDFDADLTLDPAEFGNSSVAVDIKVDSIQTAYPKPEEEDFDKVLASDWFKSEDHPSILFTSTSVSDLQDNGFTIAGELTLLGKALPVELDATFNKAVIKHPFSGKPVIGFSAKTTIDRTQWGISKFAPALGANVEVEIEGEFVHMGE